MTKILLPAYDATNGKLSEIVLDALEKGAKALPHPTDPTMIVLTVRRNSQHIDDLASYAITPEQVIIAVDPAASAPEAPAETVVADEATEADTDAGDVADEATETKGDDESA